MLALFLISFAMSMKIPLKAIKTPIGFSEEFLSLSASHLANYYNTQYYAVVYAGTPSSQYSVKIDTGSSYLWLPSTDCVDCHSIAHHFNSSLSSTYTNLYTILDLNYFEGSVTGIVSTDSFSFGDSDSSVSDLMFILVNEDEGMSALASDGIMGLAFSSNLNGHLNFIDLLKEQGKIKNSIFALYFNDNIYGDLTETDPEASIMLGDYDLSYAQEELQYVDIYSSSGFWFADLNSLTYSEKTVGITSKYVIFNTGSSMIQGPEDDIKVMMKLLTSGSYCYNVNQFNFCYCKKFSEYPVFNFTIDGKSFFLGPEDYLVSVSGWCMIMMETLEGSMAIVLGLPFLRKYYSVFDLDNSKVGLALAVKSVQISTTESSLGTYGALLAAVALIGFAGKNIMQKKTEDYKLLTN